MESCVNTQITKGVDRHNADLLTFLGKDQNLNDQDDVIRNACFEMARQGFFQAKVKTFVLDKTNAKESDMTSKLNAILLEHNDFVQRNVEVLWIVVLEAYEEGVKTGHTNEWMQSTNADFVHYIRRVFDLVVIPHSDWSTCKSSPTPDTFDRAFGLCGTHWPWDWAWRCDRVPSPKAVSTALQGLLKGKALYQSDKAYRAWKNMAINGSWKQLFWKTAARPETGDSASVLKEIRKACPFDDEDHIGD